MAEQEKKENKYTNDLGILIEKIKMNVSNLIIAHYALAEKKCIILKKDGCYKCTDVLMDYKKDESLTLISVDTEDNSYDTSNANILLTAAKLIATVDEIAKYGVQEPDIYGSNENDETPLCVEMIFKKEKKD